MRTDGGLPAARGEIESFRVLVAPVESHERVRDDAEVRSDHLVRLGDAIRQSDLFVGVEVSIDGQNFRPKHRRMVRNHFPNL